MHLPTEIIEDPSNAREIMMAASGITEDQAFAILKALAEGGWFVVPREPNHGMFVAYLTALRDHPVNPDSCVRAIGKARRRWRAMAQAGMQRAFYRPATGSQEAGEYFFQSES